MKNTNEKTSFIPMTDAAAAEKLAAEKAAKNAARLEKMRANLEKLEKRAAELLEKGNDKTESERLELLSLVSVNLHTGSSKIESLYSIDSCAACEFCQCMIKNAEKNPLIICGACYAARDSWKEAAWRRHKLNAKILSTELFTVKELETLPLPSRASVRFNEDGDTVNETMARNYIRITFAFSLARFGYFMKNTPAVEKGLHAEGIYTRKQLPENVRFIQSSVLIGIPARPVWFADAVFTVYPEKTNIESVLKSGNAWECNGKKCKVCGFYCYLARRPEKAVHIAEYLRCGAEARKKIIEALDAWKKARA